MAKRRGRQAGEGSIFFDKGKQLWTARVTDPETGKRVSKSAKQAKLVKAWFEEQKSDVARGLPAEPSRSETLAEFLPRWLELASPRLKRRTVISYEQLIHNHLIPELGHHRLRRLTPEHVQAFINERGHERSARTVMHIHACLQVALRDAMRWGLIARNVASKDFVTLPRVVEAEIHTFTPTEAGQLLAAAAGERFEHLYTMLRSTGLRLGEALALRWQGHSCATYLLAAGVSEMEIQQILGHSNLAMTRHYEHVLDDMRAAAADRLESWLGTSLDASREVDSGRPV
jgi:integrase